VLLSGGKTNGLVPIAERPGIRDDSVAAHLGKLRCPEVAPEGVVPWSRDARVEPHVRQFPPTQGTDSASQTARIEVGVPVTERLSCCVKEVLAVDEGDDPLELGLSGHWDPQKRNNPARGLSACRTGSR
jgi:hypothetical protein